MYPASNMRLNRMFALAEPPAFILDFPDLLDVPSSFFDCFFHENTVKRFSNSVFNKMNLCFVAERSEVHRNRIFEQRQWNPVFYGVLLSSTRLTKEQAKYILDDLVSHAFKQNILGNKDKENLHLILDIKEQTIPEFISRYVDEGLLKEYLEAFEKTKNRDLINAIKPKVIEWLDLDELAKFVIRNIRYNIFDIKDFVCRTDIDEHFYQELKHHEAHQLVPDIKLLVIRNDLFNMTNPEELHRVGMELAEKNSPMLLEWSKNPHITGETLYSIFKKLKDGFVHSYFFKEYRELINLILSHPNCPRNFNEEIKDFLLSESDKITQNAMKTFFIRTFIQHAPMDLALEVAWEFHRKRKVSIIKHGLVEKIHSFSTGNYTEEEQKKFWQFMAKTDFASHVDFYLSKKGKIDNFNIWEDIPQKFVEHLMVSVNKIDNDALFGLYARKDISDGQKEILFKEIKSRIDKIYKKSNKKEDDILQMNFLIARVLNQNDNLPVHHLKTFKEFLIDKNLFDKNEKYGVDISLNETHGVLGWEQRIRQNHFIKILRNVLPQKNHFSLSELIGLLSRIESPELKMNILEFSSLPQNIRMLFDEPASWQNQHEHEVKSSYAYS